ncbi:MAG: hypothetical protein EXR78_07065 [Deltaproteobacteria bacterium]|nr:hypothetical protein [Deltaproteobacteria bacterium]
MLFFALTRKSWLKMLRARIRQAYQRPVVEEKLIVRELLETDLTVSCRELLEVASTLAQRTPIDERHLLSALLDEVSEELRPVLQASGITLAALQHYTQEKGEVL